MCRNFRRISQNGNQKLVPELTPWKAPNDLTREFKLRKNVRIQDALAIRGRRRRVYVEAHTGRAACLVVVRNKTFVAVKDEIRSPLHPPTGCYFHPRGPHAASAPGNKCQTEQAMLKKIAVNRYSACHLNG